MGQKYAYSRLPSLNPTPINFATSGDNTIIAAIALTRFSIDQMFLIVGGMCNMTIKDGNGTALTGPLPLSANAGIFLDFSGEPWFTTSLGNAFVINIDQAVQVSGMVQYHTSQ